MRVPLVLRFALALVCVLPPSCLSQSVPAIPLSIDPAFWGRANAPYTLKLSVTSTSVNGKEPPRTRVSETNVYRDSTGRVREESFYDNGRPMSVSIRDPGKNTYTFMRVVDKSFFVIPTIRPTIPPPGRGWVVERLPSRVIAGLPAEGFRFTRTIPASHDGKRAADTVSHFEQVEPDPALFTVPSDYTLQQGAAKSVAP